MIQSMNLVQSSTMPYAQPAMPAPQYKLFDATAVGIAAFLGGPLAGAILIGINYQRMGDKGKAWTAYLAGALVMAAACGIGFLLPHAAATPMGVCLAVGTRAAAKSLQGEAVERHRDADGQLASGWWAAGLGMLFLAAVLAIMFAPLMPSLLASKVTFGSNDEVFYSGAATKDEARALGDSLKEQGLFQDNGANIFLDKGAGGTTISVILKEGKWEEPAVVDSFEAIFRHAAPSVGGLPIHVKLLNGDKVVERQVVVGRVAFEGKDAVLYLGSTTESDARAFGQALQKERYLNGSGAYVSISEDGGPVTVSFAVRDGLWDSARDVRGYESMMRRIAPAVGGLPVRIRLLNTTLGVEKEVVVQ